MGRLGLRKHSVIGAGGIVVIDVIAILVISMVAMLIIISIGRRSTFRRNHRLIQRWRLKSSLAEAFLFDHHNMELVKRTCC